MSELFARQHQLNRITSTEIARLKQNMAKQSNREQASKQAKKNVLKVEREEQTEVKQQRCFSANDVFAFMCEQHRGKISYNHLNQSFHLKHRDWMMEQHSATSFDREHISFIIFCSSISFPLHFVLDAIVFVVWIDNEHARITFCC